MRTVLRTAVLLLPLACGAAAEADARAYLEADGFTEIELKAEGDGFTYTAKKDGMSCTGSIELSKGIGTKSFSNSNRCA